MIITDNFKSFLKPAHKVIKEQHIKAWSDATPDKDGNDLKKWIENPFIVKCYFETGWVFFRFKENNNVHIYSMYKHPDSKIEREEIIDIFRELFTVNKIKVVTMQTHLPVKFWKDNYGFKFKANLMEIEV